MSAQHTQGRLEYGEDCDGEWWIAQVGSIEQIAYTVLADPGVAEANASRLVACWNACDGLSTEALERLGTLDRARVQMDASRVQAVAQRDELLEALEKVRTLRSWEHTSITICSEIDAAIAKVKGGAA